MNVDELAQTASVLKRHNSRYFGKQRIVTTNPHVQPRLKHIRCRTIMVPPLTSCPAKRFTPSLFLTDYPFLDFPTTFLCAIQTS